VKNGGACFQRGRKKQPLEPCLFLICLFVCLAVLGIKPKLNMVPVHLYFILR
jgi:hypothetical protein